MKASSMTTVEFAEEIDKLLDMNAVETYRIEDILDARSGNVGLDALKGAVTALFCFYMDHDGNGLISQRGRSWLNKLTRMLKTNNDYQFVFELIIRGLESEAQLRHYGDM